jgi:hypothetical protein
MSVKVKIMNSPVERVRVYVDRPSWREFLEY